MSSNYQEQPGLRNRLWIAGRSVSRDAVPVRFVPKRFELKTRTSNLGLRVDRPFVVTGMPNVVTRLELEISWKDLREPDLLEHLTSLANVGQAFDVIVFKQEADFFDGDGVSTTFLMQRRAVPAAFYASYSAITVMPDYALKATRFSAQYGLVGTTGTDLTTVPKTEATINTGSPGAGDIWIATDGHALGNLIVCTVRVGTAPPSGHDVLRISYIPLMRMFVDADQGRNFQEALQMGRQFKLTEQ